MTASLENRICNRFIIDDYRITSDNIYSILEGDLLAGKIPSKKEKLVITWIEIHQEELLADWKLAVNGKVPFKIKGLDQ